MPKLKNLNANAIAETIFGKLDPEELSTVLTDLLHAETRGRDGQLTADNRVRLEAARLILSYSLGTPTQRQEIITKNLGETPEEVRARLKHSPEARQAIRRMLDELDAQSAQKIRE